MVQLLQERLLGLQCRVHSHRLVLVPMRVDGWCLRPIDYGAVHHRYHNDCCTNYFNEYRCADDERDGDHRDHDGDHDSSANDFVNRCHHNDRVAFVLIVRHVVWTAKFDAMVRLLRARLSRSACVVHLVECLLHHSLPPFARHLWRSDNNRGANNDDDDAIDDVVDRLHVVCKRDDDDDDDYRYVFDCPIDHVDRCLYDDDDGAKRLHDV